jgi:hypothetical protein
MIQTVSALIAISKIIPIVDKWLTLLTEKYSEHKKAENKKNYDKGVEKSTTGDATDLNRELGGVSDRE